jgi:hypothetical protein
MPDLDLIKQEEQVATGGGSQSLPLGLPLARGRWICASARFSDCLFPREEEKGDTAASLIAGFYCGSVVSRSSRLAAALASATRFEEAVAVTRSSPATLAATVKSGE